MLISCLCVTHERPEWMPWLLHQFEKQIGLGYFDAELVIVDSSKTPCDYSSPSIRVISSSSPQIAPKRTTALAAAQGELIAWLDDDDWSNPSRLTRLLDAIDEGTLRRAAAGGRHAYKVDQRTLRCSLYESTYEPMIFNGALYGRAAVPKDFHGETGEDTDWQMRFLQSRPSYAVVGGEPLTAWICHGRNISNSNQNCSFDLPPQVPFDDWERDFLKNIST